MSQTTGTGVSMADGCVALVGQPNTGKSTLFGALTGARVTVANYPGTTVEVARAAGREMAVEVIDTPGLITFPSQTADEQGTVALLLRESLAAIIGVGDAKNPRRAVLLAVQLAEFGVPLVLSLNMTDEAELRNVAVDHRLLAARLGIAVIPTTATTAAGIAELTAAARTASVPRLRLDYPAEIESEIAALIVRMPRSPVDPRAVALLFLTGDLAAERWMKENLADAAEFTALLDRRKALQARLGEPLSSVIQDTRLDFVEGVARAANLDRRSQWSGMAATLGRLSTRPLVGLPLLAVVLVAMYGFVGLFGAGTLVGFVEGRLFGEIINPSVTDVIERIVPIQIISDFLVGEYGLWTMGMTYALALIFPIVTTFFLAFGVLEDSGYLPRLAVLTNRLLRTIGLNGKAVVPMVLGLGCVTMATMSTRSLETRRERLLATILLAVGVPCSAQLGVVMGLLAGVSAMASLIWAAVVVAVLFGVGWISAQLLPGERSALLVELPPLRRPRLRDVVVKTVARLEWYLKEVVPMFLFGTALLFVADVTGLLPRMVGITEPLVTGWLGLPPQTATAFVMGFLRRDFGAAGLFIIAADGGLTPSQLVVAIVTITLFVPCIASVLMIAKERGARAAAAIVGMVFPLAFTVGGILSRILAQLGWGR